MHIPDHVQDIMINQEVDKLLKTLIQPQQSSIPQEIMDLINIFNVPQAQATQIPFPPHLLTPPTGTPVPPPQLMEFITPPINPDLLSPPQITPVSPPEPNISVTPQMTEEMKALLNPTISRQEGGEVEFPQELIDARKKMKEAGKQKASKDLRRTSAVSPRQSIAQERATTKATEEFQELSRKFFP